MRGKDRVLGGVGPRFRPPAWFCDCWTVDQIARMWRLIPAEVFVQIRLFDRVGLDLATLGDVAIGNDQQRRELSRFLGRSIVHTERVVHVYQGSRGAQRIASWPDDEILRLAKQAAVFNGLRR